ncbi:M23 family metallopeptidase [Patescibacteria group bacterium]|nr:MAG: M23 family metallopeptidase [Patescibacteria group bacterium]
MKIKHVVILIIAILIAVAVVYYQLSETMPSTIPTTVNSPVITPMPETILPDSNTAGKMDFQSPLDRASERIAKKPFGIFITPKTSPVQPEKFSGYHTGTDFEIFPGEENVDVPVRAICSGKLAIKKYAIGYGGVAVQSCVLNNESVAVIYGHLLLASINVTVGNDITAGETLGLLGKGYSTETSGERKHLHLGIHKGTSINILGYVPSQAQLSDWIDACKYVCQ